MESLQSLLLRKRYKYLCHLFCVTVKTHPFANLDVQADLPRELKVIVLDKNIHHFSCFSSSSLKRHHSRFLRNISATTSYKVRHQIKIPYSKQQQQHPQSITTTTTTTTTSTTNRTIISLQSHHMVIWHHHEVLMVVDRLTGKSAGKILNF